MEKLQYVRMPFDLNGLPQGWFSKNQVNILYQLVNMTTGPILEVGPWVGRSTTVICEALRRQTERRRFITVDFGISSVDEWRRRFGEDLLAKRDPEKYLVHVNQPEGSITSLRRNLEERDLLDLVEIRRGDFVDEIFDRKFSFIFCDATHSIREIDRNVPKLIELLEPNGILACDDIRDDVFANRIRGKANFQWSHVDYMLFYGRLSS